MMTYKVKTPPESEPVSVAEAKMHLRVSHDDEDALIGRLIEAAREWCEAYQCLCYISQTLEAYIDRVVPATILLPRRPVQSVVSITYIDKTEQTQTLDAEAYRVDAISGIVRPSYGTSWPDVLPVSQAMTIEYIAGYGDASVVPRSVKQAILLLVGHLYENRESEVIGTITSPLKFSVEALLSHNRDKWV